MEPEGFGRFREHPRHFKGAKALLKAASSPVDIATSSPTPVIVDQARETEAGKAQVLALKRLFSFLFFLFFAAWRVLRPAPEPPAVQADAHGVGLRQILPDCQVRAADSISCDFFWSSCVPRQIFCVPPQI